MPPDAVVPYSPWTVTRLGVFNLNSADRVRLFPFAARLAAVVAQVLHRAEGECLLVTDP